MMNRIFETTLGVGVLLISGLAMAQETDVRSMVESHFHAADSNGDGQLDRAEFPSLIDANAERDIGRAAMVRRFGAYERAFKTADRNRDGAVVWAEIVEGSADQMQGK